MRDFVFNKVLAVILVVSLTLAGCSSQLTVLEDNETIVQLSPCVHWVGAVTNQGNCYVRGIALSDQFFFGVPDIKIFNSTRGEQFVQIYNKGDAKCISLSSTGGCITTNNGEVFLFLNGTDGWEEHQFENDELKFRTPELFYSGCRYAKLSNGEENNDLGYVNIDTPSDWHCICGNVEKFLESVTADKTLLIVLTMDHHLIVLDSEKDFSLEYELLDNVLDFDAFSNGKNSIPSLIILDESLDAYISTDNDMDSFEFLADKGNYERIGESITTVAAYNRGAAMIDSDGNVSLYGSDLSSGQYSQIYNGEVVFTNVSFVSGDPKHLYIIRDNGEFEYYGKTFDGWNNNTIVSDFI